MEGHILPWVGFLSTFGFFRQKFWLRKRKHLTQSHYISSRVHYHNALEKMHYNGRQLLNLGMSFSLSHCRSFCEVPWAFSASDNVFKIVSSLYIPIWWQMTHWHCPLSSWVLSGEIWLLLLLESVKVNWLSVLFDHSSRWLVQQPCGGGLTAAICNIGKAKAINYSCFIA